MVIIVFHSLLSSVLAFSFLVSSRLRLQAEPA